MQINRLFFYYHKYAKQNLIIMLIYCFIYFSIFKFIRKKYIDLMQKFTLMVLYRHILIYFSHDMHFILFFHLFMKLNNFLQIEICNLITRKQEKI